tara:strand:+ start:153 stop:353 length:201 start_codon:yes stop_codon:yes gene_type:complete
MYTVKITKQEAEVLKNIITHWEDRVQDSTWSDDNGVYDYEKTNSFLKKLKEQENKMTSKRSNKDDL